MTNIQTVSCVEFNSVPHVMWITSINFKALSKDSCLSTSHLFQHNSVKLMVQIKSGSAGQTWHWRNHFNDTTLNTLSYVCCADHATYIGREPSFKTCTPNFIATHNKLALHLANVLCKFTVIAQNHLTK